MAEARTRDFSFRFVDQFPKLSFVSPDPLSVRAPFDYTDGCSVYSSLLPSSHGSLR